MSAMLDAPTRAIFRSVRVPGLAAPNDTAHLKIYFPGAPTNSDMERNSGMVPCLADRGPYPVVLLLPGINVGPEGFAWLAHLLVQHGIVCVTYSLIGEEFPGLISLTPGLDLSALGPETYGTKPSSLAIGPILEDLAALNQNGLLAGCLDLSRVALGGHSAGGTTALVNANPAWFTGVSAAFTYGAHTAAATMLGHREGTMNTICPDVPVLIMGGDKDGVIAQSAARYGDPPGDALGRVVATFDLAVNRDQGDCVLAIVKGANHFSIISPQDHSTGRGFLDHPESLNDPRGLLGALILAFLGETLLGIDRVQAWQHLEARQSDLAIFRRK
jgi:dienelactone hydrolase